MQPPSVLASMAPSGRSAVVGAGRDTRGYGNAFRGGRQRGLRDARGQCPERFLRATMAGQGLLEAANDEAGRGDSWRIRSALEIRRKHGFRLREGASKLAQSTPRPPAVLG